MTRFAQLGFQGLSIGMVYALITLGFVVVFKGTRVFNFAHGDFVMAAAYVVVAVSASAPYGVAVVVAIAVLIAIAMLTERFVLRPMIGQPMFSVVLVTLGLAIVVEAVVAMIWGTNAKGPSDPIGSGTSTWGGVVFSHVGLWTLGVSAVLLVGLWFLYQRTPYGLALRATAAHQEAALAQGIDIRKMFVLSWIIAGVLAVAAGIFFGAFPRTVGPDMGPSALIALPAIIIGGFDSMAGAVIGGVVVGLIQVLGSGYLQQYGGGSLADVLPYFVMLAVLIVRPYGLFGSAEIERV